MRRWAAALACTFALGALSACSGDLPQGVDGDLTNEWAPLPAAVQFRPAAGTCHTELQQTVAAADYAPVACTQKHIAETVAVGDLTGAESMTSSDDAITQAFQACGKQANTFLGADWRTGWLIMQPVLPSKAGWSGGARWYRCDLTESSPVDGSLVSRTSSMKGGLASATSALRMSCADPTIKNDQVSEMHPIACAKGHTSEFVGVWTAPASVKTSSALTTDAVEKGCDALIAKFTAVPNDSHIRARTGWLGFPPDSTSWTSGDHGVRCFMWLDGEKMTGSYKNAGTGKLKIHYTN